jgi:Fe2+ or Zn2+ uptake regulation protein
MIREASLEKQVIEVLAISASPSTNEVTRVLNRLMAANAGRAAVRRALNALEDEGRVENVGAASDAWRLTT